MNAERETTYLPDVDIEEDGQAVTLLAELPGVSEKSVNVSVEGSVLTIDATAEAQAPKGYRLVEDECPRGKYRRDFDLSDRIDPGGIRAQMKNGILRVVLPKREEVKTKTIEITAG